MDELITAFGLGVFVMSIITLPLCYKCRDYKNKYLFYKKETEEYKETMLQTEKMIKKWISQAPVDGVPKSNMNALEVPRPY